MIKKTLKNLEFRFGHLAIPHLMWYIMIIQAGVFLYGVGNPSLFDAMALDGDAVVLHHQWWRMVTFVFLPPQFSPFWFIFYLFLWIWIGEGLERNWGTFNFNVYYFVSVLGLIISAVLFRQGVYTLALHNSLFIAFAVIFPEVELLIYFVLPVKIKWLGALQIVADLFFFLTQPHLRLSIGVCYGVFLIFFWDDIFNVFFHKARNYQFQKKMNLGVKQQISMQKCADCGVTPDSNPETDIRFCTSCYPYRPFCLDHLGSHNHQQEGL